ncbi:hydrogenase expression/formation protein HypE [Paenibacillus sp. YN15]|uniref:hydrogenase expression/formation protein HypE n=1 Tax=Paenibacillus sp. YN15 TaxID=1742774 RepID=UPI000DCCBA65|nr:hydrogenase expression/formation protein HypE [Paenibacillus sp. YN15]RAV01804.1 hydrogenase expression/formation protein HypE [Paenibacillus sp. YN15]
METELINMSHGDGGEAAHRLLSQVILPALTGAESREPLGDAALLPAPAAGKLAVTTDSFVIKPLFFPGGDIGKLAVAGTVNDLAVSGAVPLYLTVSFILEEGLPVASLQTICRSMAKEAAVSGIRLVAGDTKVVGKGDCDGLFINTTGIGVVEPGAELQPQLIEPGDAVLVTGAIGDHGIAILTAREELGLMSEIPSDCATLFPMLHKARQVSGNIRIIRDPTRGGLATALAEICEDYGLTVELEEDLLPVRPEVEGACELMGFDPLYLANEGKAVMILPARDAEGVLDALRHFSEGRDARIVGFVTNREKGQLLIRTPFGSTRRLYRLAGSMLPRIC